MLLKSLLLAIPISVFIHCYQILRSKRIEKDSLILEKTFEAESEILKKVDETSEKFLEWNFLAFIEDYDKKQVNIKEYANKYLKYFGTVNEFHTFRS